MGIEILAPVGGYEQLISAIKAGANAVYLGTQDFNARRNAHNFDNLNETVEFCHNHGVKVYVTLNTVIKNNEIGAFANTVKDVANAGADAVIVQDLGAVSLIKKICPDLPLHASTQMTVHNLSGVKMLEEMGFSRVVLAREMSKNEIKYICDNSKLEIEVFTHGALCVSVSGQCYLSSMLGARSGNRGLCAQPCRLDFNNGERGYALSLKDMSLYEDINELISLGVKSLKIEGRMKRPEYVYKAVSECKKALNNMQPDMQTLKSVFSRSGFTNAYFKAQISPCMFGRRTDEDVHSMQNVLKSIEEEISKTDYRKAEKLKTKQYDITEFETLSVTKNNINPKIRIRVERLSQLTDKMQEVADKIIVPYKELLKQNLLNEKYVAELPLLFYGTDKDLQTELQKIKDKGIKEVYVGNIGAIFEAQKLGFTVHTDYSMNVTNKYSVEVLKKLNVSSVTMSFETNSKDVKGTLPVGIIAYGYLPLMTYRSCPARTKAGCKGCSKTPVIKDRKNTQFTVLCRGAYSQLLNSVPLYIGDKLNKIGCDFVTLYFTKEDKKQSEKVFLAFISGQEYQGKMTRGLYFKELI